MSRTGMTTATTPCRKAFTASSIEKRIGYADEHGNTLVEPRFAFGFPFENGKAKVTDTGELEEAPGSDGEYHYWESDDWYYIDRKGQRIE